MRIDKLLAHYGYGSRKDVKTLLKQKNVTVNGERIKTSKFHINPDVDIVEVNGDVIQYKEFIYYVLHKPSGYISATVDDREQTVIDLLPMRAQQIYEPFPVGRLDKDTEGLLLITNDGKLAHALTSPRREVPKTYYAHIDGRVSESDVKAFHDGVTLDDGYKTKTADLVILKSGTVSEIELTITEGKFHQVKRMFEAVDKKVIYLKRIQMGEISLDDALPLGAIRELTEKELNYCEQMVGEQEA